MGRRASSAVAFEPTSEDCVVSGSPVWLPAVMFLGAGAAIWVAGIQLSEQTDVLTMRLGLGSALGGLILLAIAAIHPRLARDCTPERRLRTSPHRCSPRPKSP